MLIKSQVIPAWKKPQGLCRTGLECQSILGNQRHALQTHAEQGSSGRWGVRGEVEAFGGVLVPFGLLKQGYCAYP